MKLLLYCTKAEPTIEKISDNKYGVLVYGERNETYCLNGKIAAECDYEIEEILYLPDMEKIREHKCECCVFEDKLKRNFNAEDYSNYFVDGSDDNYIIWASKWTATQLHNYLKGKDGKAVHVKNLHIFDKLYKLNDCVKPYNKWCYINKAPQNMQKVWFSEDNEEAYEDYILISVHPEELCRILNKEQTIIIKKKVLKEMLK